MKIAHKLWLAAGVLVLTVLAAGVVLLLGGQTVRAALDEIARVEEPTRAASFEMEINVVEIGRDVRSYLETADLRYREQFAEKRAEFEEFKSRHDELADTATGREQSEAIEGIFREYVALGEGLMDGRGADGQAPRADLQRFARLQQDLDAVLDEEVQPWTGRQLAEAEDRAAGAIRNVGLALAALLLAGLLVGASSAYLIGRGIVGSFRGLKEGADRIGRGELGHTVEVVSRDELADVAVALNGMLDRRREAEAALRESEVRFRALSDAAFEGVAIHENGEVAEANAAFVAMFGYGPREGTRPGAGTTPPREPSRSGPARSRTPRCAPPSSGRPATTTRASPCGARTRRRRAHGGSPTARRPRPSGSQASARTSTRSTPRRGRRRAGTSAAAGWSPATSPPRTGGSGSRCPPTTSTAAR